MNKWIREKLSDLKNYKDLWNKILGNLVIYFLVSLIRLGLSRIIIILVNLYYAPLIEKTRW